MVIFCESNSIICIFEYYDSLVWWINFFLNYVSKERVLTTLPASLCRRWGEEIRAINDATINWCPEARVRRESLGATDNPFKIAMFSYKFYGLCFSPMVQNTKLNVDNIPSDDVFNIATCPNFTPEVAQIFIWYLNLYQINLSDSLVKPSVSVMSLKSIIIFQASFLYTCPTNDF